MNKSLIITLSILALFLFVFGGCGVYTLNLANQDASQKVEFNQKFDERTAFYDNMWKTVKEKSAVALRNDSSFQTVVNSIMEQRKDSEGLFMKWVTESNPAATFGEVSSLYKDLSRTIEAKRDQFFEQEKMMQDIKRENDYLFVRQPQALILGLLGRKPLEYKPITSDKTDNVIRTGKDNETLLL